MFFIWLNLLLLCVTFLFVCLFVCIVLLVFVVVFECVSDHLMYVRYLYVLM